MKTFNTGGIHPPESKFTGNSAIEVMPLPAELAIPMNQHLGKPAKPIVKLNDEVKKGQLIGEADGFISANVHASTSGKIKAIKSHPHPGGQYAMTIFITPDGKDEWAEGLDTVAADWKRFSKDEILKKIKDAGIVGMGGAGFPTNVKLSPPPDKKIDTIILNGAECEPFLTADHRLMVESAEQVVIGMEIMASLLPAPVKLAIGVESNKPDAIAALEKFAAPKQIEVVSLKTKYPQGAEKQLINAITGRKVAEGELPFDKGCIVQNIGTAAAVFDAVCRNRPLIERVLTVSGMEITQRKNISARIGTGFKDIIAFCGSMSDKTNQVISGGPMMGKAIFSLDVPVVKTTSGILFINNRSLDKSRERTCIRCGRCVEVCPQGLAPWLLANTAQLKQFDEIQLIGLANCTECGSCTYVCPSGRELVHWIKYAKALVSSRQKRKSA